MASFLNLILESTQKRLVRSLADVTYVGLPDFFQEDTGITIDFQLVRQVGGGEQTPIFERVSLAGYALTVAVGANPADGTQWAANSSWTESADGYTLTGTLNLNTAGIATALTGVSSVSALFEILINGSYRAQFGLNIRKSVILSGVLASPGEDVALGSAQARAQYVPRNQAGPFTMLSKDGTKEFLIYPDDDGSVHAELLS